MGDGRYAPVTAEVFATVVDRPVHYEPIDYDVLAEMLTAIGIDPHLVQQMRHDSQDPQYGVFAGTIDVIEGIRQTTPPPSPSSTSTAPNSRRDYWHFRNHLRSTTTGDALGSETD